MYQELITKKILEMNWIMNERIIKLLKDNEYNSIDELYKSWYKINYKTLTEKTDDWYMMTITPFIEKMKEFQE